VSSIRERAERRFERLRRQAAGSVDADESAPAPSGWCIATVARLVRNEGPIAAIQAIQSRLSSVGELYPYPPESLHLSLLGCTQREPERPAASGRRIDDIARAVDRVTENVGPVRVELAALNLVGSQFFVEVLTDDRAWRSLRERLASELTGIGENPLTYPDPEPMHVNIARVLRLDAPSERRRLLVQDRPAVDVTLDLATIELVITDFVLSPATTTVVHTRHLGRSPRGEAGPGSATASAGTA